MTRQAATAEAGDLALLTVAAGSRVVVVGDPDGRLARGLATRGCTLVDFASDEPVDVVLIGDLAEWPTHPRDLMAEAVTRLSDAGRVVAVARNVTHGAIRLALVHGQFPAAGGEPVFDRNVLGRLFTDAGLAVVDRLEVRRGLDQTDVEVDLASFKPEVVASVDDDPDSHVAVFVFVGRRSGGDPSDQEGAAGASLVEELQDRVRRAEQEASGARADADDRAERCRELEEAVRQRVAELDDLHGELAHARMDLQLKDAFALEMRSAADDLTRTVARLEEELRQAHVLVATRSGELTATREELDFVTTEMGAVTSRASYVLIEEASRALERYPPVSRLVHGLARRLARVAGRGTSAGGEG